MLVGGALQRLARAGEALIHRLDQLRARAEFLRELRWLAAGRLEVDGAPVPEPYLVGDAGAGELEVELGPAEYLVLGDHRAASTDGRDFGPVGADALLGRVRFAYWPPRRLGRRG